MVPTNVFSLRTFLLLCVLPIYNSHAYIFSVIHSHFTRSLNLLLLTTSHHSLVALSCQVEVTKFEDLEETHAEVRLKQTLWKSQQDWEADYELWLTVS